MAKTQPTPPTAAQANPGWSLDLTDKDETDSAAREDLQRETDPLPSPLEGDGNIEEGFNADPVKRNGLTDGPDTTEADRT